MTLTFRRSKILEQSLLEFRGSLVLVTHDRYMLDRLSNIVVGLDGQGSAESFADYSQWESWQVGRTSAMKAKARSRHQAASFGGVAAAGERKALLP